MKARRRKCKSCGEWFKPTFSSMQMVCSSMCAIEYGKEHSKKQEKKDLQKRKKELKTKSDWEKVLTTVFNKYIRMRDENKGCISCGSSLVGVKFDAGHCFPAGHYPQLRYDEDNVMGQCVKCNQHLHGNQAEYLLRLPERIGEERYNALLERRKETESNQRIRTTIDDIKELIKVYKGKVNDLK